MGEKMNSQKILIWFFLLVLFFAAGSSVLALGIYEFGWSGPWMAYIPLPAALVDGRFITQRDVFRRVGAYQTLTGEQADNQRKTVVEKLTEEKIIADLAKKRGITVNDQEAEQYYSSLLNRFGIKSEDASNEIRQKFGWSPEEFRRYLVIPDLLETKLKILFMAAAEDGSVFRQMRLIENRIGAGLDFIEAVKLYSEDEESRYIGGETGYRRLNEIEPWILDEVRALKNGEVSDIIVSSNGYHVMQMVAREGSGDDEQVLLRQIFIKGPSFEEYLEKEKENHRIYVFGKL